jgi:hypothetical protein
MARFTWSIATVLQMCMTVATLASSSPSPTSSCLDTARPAVSTVILHLADRVDLASEARDEMMREAAYPWRKIGVDVRWSLDPPRLGDGHAHVSVTVMRDVSPDGVAIAAGSTRRGRLASILFVDGKPTTLIRADLLEVERQLDGMRVNDEAFGRLAPMLRHRLEGRVLGRAIAHELGHFLFASADHTPFGLMRAIHRTDHLLAPSHEPFRVVAPQTCSISARALVVPK